MSSVRSSPPVLVVTSGHLCRNPRALKEATTLALAGHDVTVLYVREHPPSEAFDQEILAAAPFRHQAVNMLPGAGRAAFLRRLRLWLARRAARHFGRKTIHTLGPASSLLDAARRLPAALTIVHNEVPHWVGVQLSATGRCVAADIEDWHSEDLLPADRVHRPLAEIRRVERQLLDRLAYTTTTSHALSAALVARYGGHAPHVISNSFPLQPDPRTAPNEVPTFFWFSQTLGPGRGLEAFLTAWSRTHSPSRLVLLGAARDSFVSDLLSLLPAARHGQVSFRPLVAPALLPSLIAQHDIGLALENAAIPNRDLTITNKILQYANAGLALVASGTAGQREVLAHAPDAGRIIDLADPSGTANALEELITSRETLARCQRASRRLAEEFYSWERETPRLLQLAAHALSLAKHSSP